MTEPLEELRAAVRALVELRTELDQATKNLDGWLHNAEAAIDDLRELRADLQGRLSEIVVKVNAAVIAYVPDAESEEA